MLPAARVARDWTRVHRDGAGWEGNDQTPKLQWAERGRTSNGSALHDHGLRFVRGRAAPSSTFGAEDASVEVSSAWGSFTAAGRV